MRRAALLALIAGCQEYDLSREPEPVPEGEPPAEPVTPVEEPEEDPGDWMVETFHTDDDPPVDVLFALDKSCSMSGEIFALGGAFGSFIRQVDLATGDWHIGVVTQDDGCFNGGWIEATTPNYEGRFLSATRNLGIFGGTDLEEALLQLTDVALGKAVPGRCNAGFSRPEAALHVIAVSDEPEQSGADWASWLASYEQRYDVVVVSAVVDQNGTCGSDATGYVEAAQATGGMLLDVCTSRWGSFAADLGDATALATRIYVLSGVPDPTSLKVRVGGVQIDAWDWDADRNAVVLHENPPAGTRVDVAWLPLVPPT